jgi:hypothetical protein
VGLARIERATSALSGLVAPSGSLDRVNESGSNLGCPRWSGWPRLRETDRRLRPPSRHRSGQRSGVRGCPEADRGHARPSHHRLRRRHPNGWRQTKPRGGDPARRPGLPSREAPGYCRAPPGLKKNLMARRKDRAVFAERGTCVPVREEEPESHGETVVLVSVLVRPQSRREDTQTPEWEV